MMRPMNAALLAAVTALTTAGAAHADPFDPTRVPADAKYVIHIDVDAIRPTQLWKAADDKLAGNEAFGAKMGQFEMASGMHFPNDLHDVTVYGAAAGDGAAVTVVHAKMSKDQLTAALQFANNYGNEIFGKYEILTWNDNGDPKAAAFHDDSTFVIAATADHVKAALDTMDAKAARAPADSPLFAGAVKPAAGQPPTLVYLATLDLAGLAKPGETPNLMVKQIDSGFVTLTERPAAATTNPSAGGAPTGAAAADAVVKLTVRAKSPEAAQQLQTMAGGLKAFVGMQAANQAADPRLAFAATVLKTTTLTQTGNTIEVGASMNVDQLQQAADQLIDKAKKAKGDDDKGL